MRSVALLIGLYGCTPGSGDTADSGSGGACGDVTTYDMSVTAKVVDAKGKPAADVAVELDDRGWDPGTVLGSGTTGSDGKVTLNPVTITSVDKCWATILDYVVAADGGDAGKGEVQINSPLFNGIEDGTLKVDVSSIPIKLE